MFPDKTVKPMSHNFWRPQREEKLFIAFAAFVHYAPHDFSPVKTGFEVHSTTLKCHNLDFKTVLVKGLDTPYEYNVFFLILISVGITVCH